MKTSFVAFATLSLIGACSAQNANANANAQVNANSNAADAGSVAMDRLMTAKVNSRNKCRKTGLCGKPPKGVGNRKKTKCVNGMAGEFPCKGIDFHSFLSHTELGSGTLASGGGEGSDAWGWTSASGREFAIITQTDGTAFAEIDNQGGLKYLGRLPTQTVPSLWRDAKVSGDFVYIGSEALGHGIQIFDLKKLEDPTLRLRPKIFSTTSDVTVYQLGNGRSHNVVNGATDNVMAFVGQRASGRGGPCFFDVTVPTNPVGLGCYGGDNYTHDAQSVVYKGPDTRYTGKEIMFAYNEDSLTILDITSKSNIVQLSRTGYNGSAYTHQGWLTDDKQSHLLLDDELDELDATSSSPDGRTATYVWDVSDLTAPFQEGIYKSPVTSIDHNQYTVDGLSYQANYASGLRVVDVSQVSSGGTASSMSEVAFFDVRPEDNVVDFFGAWNVYPYFKSGYLLINSIERGAFVVKRS